MCIQYVYVYIVSVYPPTPALSKGGRCMGRPRCSMAAAKRRPCTSRLACHGVLVCRINFRSNFGKDRIRKLLEALAAAVGCRHDPAFAAMVFWCDFGGFSVKSESDIRRWQLWAAGTIRPSS